MYVSRFSCSLCLKQEQDLYKKNPLLGHINRVKDYACRTSTSTLREHLFTAHGISSNENDEDDEEASNDKKSKSKSGGFKQMKLSFKQKLADFQPCTNKYELSRDLIV